MPDPYDPSNSDVLEDVTIDSVVYIVTAFNDAGAAPQIKEFELSGGGWRGDRITWGAQTASMTIQVRDADEVSPTEGTEFAYRGGNWVIAQAGKSASNSSPSARDISLRKKTPIPA